jgi:hypothetical protein
MSFSFTPGLLPGAVRRPVPFEVACAPLFRLLAAPGAPALLRGRPLDEWDTARGLGTDRGSARANAPEPQARVGERERPGMAVVVRFEDMAILSEAWR